MILSLDTDSHGYHSHLQNGRTESVALPKSMDVEVRRINTYVEAKRFFTAVLETSGNDVFCEEPLALKNGKTTRTLCLMAGAIWAAHVEVCVVHQINSNWHWVDVASWKKRIVGNGNSSKEQIREFVIGSQMFAVWCAAHPGAEAEHELNKNLYDAWCILQYGKWFKSREATDA